MEESAIVVRNVSKTFKLPHERTGSVKSALLSIPRRKQKSYEVQKALEDVSFDIKKGEFFGIVGRNGSGKSTLLKMLAGIYVPSSGDIHVNGKLTPFIELGVGFNPELTGRENVFLNGALLGFSRSEMAAMYDDIVDFAEIERFMDQKLKNYSSGMQVRLAFSIAIQAKSDILVLDEVLAVGDEAFQQKCISVFEKYKAQKQTIVLVTHDMSVVERFCNRAMLIRDGKMVKIGSPRQVAQMYSDSNKEAYEVQKEKEEAKKYTSNIKLSILDAKTKKPAKRFTQGDVALIRVAWDREGVKHSGVALMKQSGEYVFGPNTYQDKQPVGASQRELYYAVRLNVGPGEYFLKAGLFGKTDSDVLEFMDEGPSFMIEKDKNSRAWGGLAFLPHAWGDEHVQL
jgi:ABC-2 type transport system ATP-binding protein